MLKKCPFCGEETTKFYCIDRQGNRYVECTRCYLIYQKYYKKLDCSINYWTDAIDPDGKQRDLTQERHFKVKNWYGGIIEYINKQKSGRILDVGCGLGYLLSAINNSFEKVGYEIHTDALAFTRRNFPDISLYDDLNYISTIYKKESFDIVVCYHVIEHVETPAQFFQSLVGFVAKGGTLIVGTPNVKSFCSKWFKKNYRLLGDGHICMFSFSHLSKLFLENGLNVIKIEYPFFKTEYFTIKNLVRLFNPQKISPPFYGNIMTFYGKK